MTGFEDPNRRKIVLAVDDEPTNLALVERTVSAAGYSFFGVESGAKCLSLVARVWPRIILLDIHMPEINGFETCRRLRAMATMDHSNRRLASVPVLFLTASKTVEDVREGMAAGGNDFIIKPFDPTKLLTRMAHWMKHGAAPMAAKGSDTQAQPADDARSAPSKTLRR